jgi:hypothetical protein
MQKTTRYKVVLLLAVLLTVFLAVTYLNYLYVKHQQAQRQEQEHLDQRHHLLCEVLQPSMSTNEVLKTLEQFGEIRVDGDVTQPNASLYIVFENPEVYETYGGYFFLGFVDYKYIRAYDVGFDARETTICSFWDNSDFQP